MDDILYSSASSYPWVEQNRGTEWSALWADNPQRCNSCVDSCDHSYRINVGRCDICSCLFLFLFVPVSTHQTCFLSFVYFPTTLERVLEQAFHWFADFFSSPTRRAPFLWQANCHFRRIQKSQWWGWEWSQQDTRAPSGLWTRIFWVIIVSASEKAWMHSSYFTQT